MIWPKPGSTHNHRSRRYNQLVDTLIRHDFVGRTFNRDKEAGTTTRSVGASRSRQEAGTTTRSVGASHRDKEAGATTQSVGARRNVCPDVLSPNGNKPFGLFPFYRCWRLA